MIQSIWRKISSIVLASIVAVSFISATGSLLDGTFGSIEANASELAQTNDNNVEKAISDIRDETVTDTLEGEIITSPIPLDNDGLFEEYVEIQLEMSSVQEKSSARGSRLTGTNRKVYLKLKDEISKVANGTLKSTVFEVPIKELGLEKETWTAKELGGSAIVVDGSISTEAVNALSQKLDFDLNKVITALLADCPYELYWYDKVSGVTTQGPGISASSSGTEWRIGFEDSIVLSFSVAKDYAAGKYLVDTSNAERVQNAVANARSVINEYASVSDYEKLAGYRSEICDLVTYNYNAANDDSMPYGDPWQIISVFDGDTNTNVVCEGYAKAFQYLCDLTSFEDDITCITVTGSMKGGTGAGAHMWNVVNMDDGNNYLVDVTNCDAGTIGADEQLFIVGSDSGSVADGYTFICKEGNILYRYDQSLWNYYNESELSVSSGSYEIHVWDGGIITKEATTTEEGILTYTCTVCGETKTKTIPRIVVKTGWKLEDGYWYFYDDDGTIVKRSWRKDSKGWCYLGADGKMVTSSWVKDSKGWCWISTDGYMLVATKWVQYEGSWYHITNGYRDQNKWMKDSKGWCYLGTDGKMLTNGWAKDSKGWCWMGSDGYWVSNKWVKSGGQWYYMKSNHYMAANEWAKDSSGWMYMDVSGKITKNKWVKSGGYWYYMKSNGYMATGTMTINGIAYKFNSAGRWIS